MAFCRFSSMDWRCDVYVYESQDGFVTHTAGARPPQAFFDALPPRVVIHSFEDDAQWRRWVERQIEVQRMLDEYEYETIDLPRASKTFLVSTPGECADLLVSLREEGFTVPDEAIEALREVELEGYPPSEG